LSDVLFHQRAFTRDTSGNLEADLLDWGARAGQPRTSSGDSESWELNGVLLVCS